jgi:hypothetical protein
VSDSKRTKRGPRTCGEPHVDASDDATRADRGDAQDHALPDARDGLTRAERIVLLTLRALTEARNGRHVPLVLLHAHVLERIDLSVSEVAAIVSRVVRRGRQPKSM